MNPAVADMMGGMSHAEAEKIVKEYENINESFRLKSFPTAKVKSILEKLITNNGIKQVNDKRLDTDYSLAKTFTDNRMCLTFEKDGNLLKKFYLDMPTISSFEMNNKMELKALNDVGILRTYDELVVSLFLDDLESKRNLYKKDFIDKNFTNFPEKYYTSHGENYSNVEEISAMLESIVNLAESSMREWKVKSEKDWMQGMKDMRF